MTITTDQRGILQELLDSSEAVALWLQNWDTPFADEDEWCGDAKLWRDARHKARELLALPQAQADGWLTDIENAPRDGSEVLFPIEFVTRAYWDKDLKRWVMSFGLHMDYVNAPTRYRLPRAQTAPLIAEKRDEQHG